MSGTPQEQERQAWSLVASIVGAITIARALPVGDAAQAVLDSVLASAMQAVTD
jgi:TetR/AcrR family transcriptional repressor of nem operon